MINGTEGNSKVEQSQCCDFPITFPSPLMTGYPCAFEEGHFSLSETFPMQIDKDLMCLNSLCANLGTTFARALERNLRLDTSR